MLPTPVCFLSSGYAAWRTGQPDKTSTVPLVSLAKITTPVEPMAFWSQTSFLPSIFHCILIDQITVCSMEIVIILIQNLKSVCYVPDNILSTLHILTLIITPTSKGRFYCQPKFITKLVSAGVKVQTHRTRLQQSVLSHNTASQMNHKPTWLFFHVGHYQHCNWPPGMSCQRALCFSGRSA